MATLPAKICVIPAIAFVRTTCAGTQYIVATPEYLDVVTVNGESITCTCHQVACSHIQIVQIRRAQDAASDSHREAYRALFDLSYGD